MSQADYLKISGLIFLVVGALLLLQAWMGWVLIVNTWEIPFWFSWAGGVILIVLAIHAFYYARQYKYI